MMITQKPVNLILCFSCFLALMGMGKESAWGQVDQQANVYSRTPTDEYLELTRDVRQLQEWYNKIENMPSTDPAELSKLRQLIQFGHQKMRKLEINEARMEEDNITRPGKATDYNEAVSPSEGTKEKDQQIRETFMAHVQGEKDLSRRKEGLISYYGRLLDYLQECREKKCSGLYSEDDASIRGDWVVRQYILLSRLEELEGKAKNMIGDKTDYMNEKQLLLQQMSQIELLESLMDLELRLKSMQSILNTTAYFLWINKERHSFFPV